MWWNIWHVDFISWRHSLVMLVQWNQIKSPVQCLWCQSDHLANQIQFDECCALAANLPANLQICRTQPEPVSEGSGSVWVRLWWVRFGSSSNYVFSTWVLVRFGSSQNVSSSLVRVWFDSHLNCKVVFVIFLSWQINFSRFSRGVQSCTAIHRVPRRRMGERPLDIEVSCEISGFRPDE